MGKVKSYTIYEEYFELITLLTEEEQAYLLLAINRYMFHDEKPKLNENQTKIFNNLKRPLEKSKNKSKLNQNKVKSNSNENQNEIKSNSNENQNETKTKTHQDVIVNVNNILDFIENNLNRTISSYELEQIELLVKEYSNEIVLYAFQKTLDAGKCSLNYTKGILKNWNDDNLKTLEEIKKQENKKSKNANIPEWFNKDLQTDEKYENSDFQDFIKVFRGEKDDNDF